MFAKEPVVGAEVRLQLHSPLHPDGGLQGLRLQLLLASVFRKVLWLCKQLTTTVAMIVVTALNVLGMVTAVHA